MTSAWFLGATHSVPQSESQVRSTVEPIRDDGENAELKEAPEYNELETDNSGELVGLSPRDVSGHTVDIEKYPPWWADKASTNLNVHTDDQVSSSGTAAQREMAGIQGHGTTQYEESLEPVVRDGATYGDDYFVTAPSGIQDGMGHYMESPIEDQWAGIAAQSTAIANSRAAYQGTQWGDLFKGF